MSVATSGPLRGFIGRWLMRLQAAKGVVQMVSIELTAASTISLTLQNAGLGQYVPYVFGLAALGTPLFAYVYVDFGLYNRKNRENVDRGNNFATPRDRIDDTLIGAAVFGAVHGREPDDEELETIKDAVEKPWHEFRDGVDVGGD